MAARQEAQSIGQVPTDQDLAQIAKDYEGVIGVFLRDLAEAPSALDEWKWAQEFRTWVAEGEYSENS